MIGGIDLGGTKIEARVFDDTFTEVARNRVPTPVDSYAAMLDAITTQVAWLETHGTLTAVGLGSPGLIQPSTGMMLTANLPASGQRLAHDISTRTGRPITVINDASAFTLSEATLGAASTHQTVVGLIIGTGVAGGYTVHGQLIPDRNGQSAEFGHLPLPATFIADHALPLLPCGCGLTGCIETYLSGPGLARLARHMTGQTATPEQIMTDMPAVRAVWLNLAAQLASMITRTHDPDAIVLGGGLGMHNNLPQYLTAAMQNLTLAHTSPPDILQASQGDASGALGAAIYAHHMQKARG